VVHRWYAARAAAVEAASGGASLEIEAGPETRRILELWASNLQVPARVEAGALKSSEVRTLALTGRAWIVPGLCPRDGGLVLLSSRIMGGSACVPTHQRRR
jgi:hypothetical protein